MKDLGGPMSYSHYNAGWAVAGDTPFTWTKQVASSFGGTRNPLVIYWPKRIKANGEVRSQFHHVIDIAPTILEAAGVSEPKIVDGAAQIPIQGVSMEYTFDDAKAKSRHTTQYFEIFGNRGVYKDGWLAGTVHRAPWEAKPRASLADDKWELYDTENDFSLTTDLAADKQDKLKEMQAAFTEDAIKYHVLPIDDRQIERANPSLAGRPDLMQGRKSLTVYEGMNGMMENVFINVKNRSHSVVADVTIPKNANGVILCQGGRFGGWTMYLKNGRPIYTYNWVGLKRYTVASKQPIAPGKATIRYEFAYDGGMGAGGTGTLFVNDKQVAQGRIDHTNALIFSADEGADVGEDLETPVTEDYKQNDNKFTGKIAQVTINLQDMKPVDKAVEEKDRELLIMDQAAED
jgi:arylsulfatase